MPEAVATPAAEKPEDECRDEEPDGGSVGQSPPDDAAETAEKNAAPEADGSAAGVLDVRRRGLPLTRGLMVVR